MRKQTNKTLCCSKILCKIQVVRQILLQAGMSLLGHGRVTGAELGNEEGELGDMSNGLEEVLVEGLGGGDDGVSVVKAQLCSIQSSNGAIESGAVLWKIRGSITSCLKLGDELFHVCRGQAPIPALKPLHHVDTRH